MGRLRIISGYRRTDIHIYLGIYLINPFYPQLINRAVSVRLELINELPGMDYATFNILRLFTRLHFVIHFDHINLAFQ